MKNNTNLIGKKVLNDYEVIEKIGNGAFGTVFKVTKSDLSGEYTRALKYINFPSDEQYLNVLQSMEGDIRKTEEYFNEAFKNIVSEITILNNLTVSDAPNIVRYYDSRIEEHDNPKKYEIFLLMEYLEPLNKSIETNNYTVREIIKLGMDILIGLDYCHKNGIIHRDIKADNIFLSQTGHYKIGDFGVSKVLDSNLTGAKTVKGTPNFLAPEVFQGGKNYTKSVDLYSLGITLYRLLNHNRNPFLPYYPEQYYASDDRLAFERRMNGEVPNPPQIGGDLIGSAIIKALLAEDQRYESASEFYNTLNYALNNTSEEILNTVINPNTRNDYSETLITELNSKSDISQFNKNLANTTLGKPIEINNEELTPSFRNLDNNQFSSTIYDTVIDDNSKLEVNKTKEKEIANPINYDLFESIGETQVQPNLQIQNNQSYVQVGSNNDYNQSSQETVKKTTVKPIDNNILKKFIYFLPFLIAFIGLVAYFVVIPNIYGHVISIFDWLLSNPENIITSIRNPSFVFSNVNFILGIRIFWYLWLAFFIGSLFMVGKELQKKPEPDVHHSILIKKQPYALIQTCSNNLKSSVKHSEIEGIKNLNYQMKKLEERLQNESDFGIGGVDVINIENQIALIIKDLNSAIVPNNLNNNFPVETYIEKVRNVNSLLDTRTLMKRK